MRIASPPPPALFIGRELERRRLCEALTALPAAVVYGVPGVGKSALAHAVAQQWSAPVAYHVAHPGEPLAAVLDQARRQLARGPVPQATSDAQRLADLARRLDATRSSSVHGALWVLDDLHALASADRARLLADLVPRLSRGRVLATSRERWSLDASSADRLELRLTGLDAASARALWASLDGLYGEAAGFEQAWSATRGSPLLLRRAHAGGFAGDDPIEASVRELAADERFVAGAVALAGVELPPAAVAALLPAPRGGAALVKLVERMIVDVRTARGAGCAAAVMLHELFRDALLRDLGDDERRAIHLALARVLRVADLDVVATARAVAAHLCAVGDYNDAGRYLHDVSRELVRHGAAADLLRAVDAIPPGERSAELALVRARALGRLLELRGAYDELERLVSARAEPALPLRIAFAEVAVLTGNLEAAAPIARELCAAGDEAPAAAVMLQALLATYRGEGRAARRQLDVALARSDDALERATLLFCHAFTAWVDELDAEAEESMRRALGCFRGSPVTVRATVFAPIFFAEVLARLGRFEEADEMTTRAELACGGHGDVRRELYLRALRASIAHERGERMTALAEVSEVRDAFLRSGYLLGRLWADAALGRVLLSLGRRHAALEHLCRASEEARHAGIVAAVRTFERCRDDDPVRMLREPLSRTPRPTRGRAVTLQVIGAVHAARDGAVEDARARIDSVAAQVTAAGYGVERALVHLARAVLERAAGRAAAAHAEEERAAAAAAEEGADADLTATMARAIGSLRVVIGTQSQVAARAPDLTRFRVVVDARNHELRLDGRVVSLQRKVTLRQLLYALAGRPGGALSKEELAPLVWSRAYDPRLHDNAMKSNMTHLRRLLEGSRCRVQFEGDGWRLVVPSGFVFVAPDAWCGDATAVAAGD